MIIPLIRLELRKNVLSAASAAAAFLVTLPVCRLVSSSTGLEIRYSLDAALTAWIILGLPLAAALIGASSGASSASRDALDCEAILPPSPGRRAASSLAASLLLVAAFAAFVLVTSVVLGSAPGRMLAPAQKAWGAAFWHNLHVAPLLALATFDVLAGAWALSRLIGHGVAGGLLALLLTSASGAALAACFGLQLLHHEWGASCYAAALALASAGALAKVWAGALAARWSERRSGPRALSTSLALLILPGAAIWAVAGGELRMLDAKVMLLDYEHALSRRPRGDSFPRGSRALAAAGEGVVLKTLRGGIVIADGAGVRPLIPEQNAGLSDILLDPFKTWIRGAWREENGVLWVERYVSPNAELWRIEGTKVESIRMTDHGSFSMFAGVPLKHRYPDGKRLLVASAEDYFRRGDKATWHEGYKSFLALRRPQAGAGRVACAGKCLEAKGRRWKLPGIANERDAVFPHDFGGRRAYLVPVLNGKTWSTILCRDDGSTAVAWPEDAREGTLPDGTLFTVARGKLWSIAPDGKIAPPLDLTLSSDLSTVSSLMRRSKDKAWFVQPKKLLVLDAGGRTVLTRPLPEDIEDAMPLKSGFLITTKRSAYFSDWDGNLRRVENPR